MSDEKPLHVRVAEALGWTYRKAAEIGDLDCGGTVFMVPPGKSSSYCNVCAPDQPPRYDTDWSATGPLIEKYGIALEPQDPTWQAPEIQRGDIWLAQRWTMDNEQGWEVTADVFGATPLIATCRLILILKEAGKLDG